MVKELENKLAPEVGGVSVLSEKEADVLYAPLESEEIRANFKKSFEFNCASVRRLVREGYILN